MKTTRQYHNAYIFFSKSLTLFTERLLVYMISINESRVLHYFKLLPSICTYIAHIKQWIRDCLSDRVWHLPVERFITLKTRRWLFLLRKMSHCSTNTRYIYIYIPFSQMSIEWQSNRLEHNRLNVRIATK